MHVRELLRGKGPGVITVEEHTEVRRAVRLLMQHRIGGLPVVSTDGALLGFLSERDVVRAVDRSNTGIRAWSVERIMRRPAPTCRADDHLREVMSRMTRERLRHLVVVDGETIAGVVSVGDLVKHRLDELETERGVLRDYVAASRGRALR